MTPDHSAVEQSGRGTEAELHERASTGGKLLFSGYLVLLLVEYGGLSKLVPLLQAVRFSTILTYSMLLYVAFKYGFRSFTGTRQTRLLALLILFTALSVLWAIVQWNAFNAIRPLVDYMALYILTVHLVDRQERADALSWVMLVTIVHLVLRNADMLSSPERVGVFDAPYFMGDGNDFAWSMVILLPIVLNLALGSRNLLTRVLALVGVAVCLFGIVGSGSRGAALGLAASLLYYWMLLSRHKAAGAIAIILIVVGVGMLAPTTYFDRLQSIGTYQEDNSAQSRLQVWRAATKMAVDHPLGVGAGNFSSGYGRYYIPSESQNSLAWGSRRWLSAHSIYFKMLGEYGFLGLLLLLAVIHANLRDNVATRRLLFVEPQSRRIAPTWPALVNMSIVGYAVCGAFLGGISYPHLFLLSALTVAAHRSAQSRQPQGT
jgi:probable O-glycosylation ligase (exosortase A-associated)